jgi:cellobiose-specific phosphotransferase system component IIA
MADVEVLHQRLQQAREAYRLSRQSASKMLQDAATLGPANPDGAWLRRQANAQLRANLQNFIEALAAYQHGVLESGEAGIMQGDRLVGDAHNAKTTTETDSAPS